MTENLILSPIPLERLKAEFDNKPQDVEWAIDDERQIWILQSRDLYLK